MYSISSTIKMLFTNQQGKKIDRNCVSGKHALQIYTITTTLHYTQDILFMGSQLWWAFFSFSGSPSSCYFIFYICSINLYCTL